MRTHVLLGTLGAVLFIGIGSALAQTPQGTQQEVINTWFEILKDYNDRLIATVYWSLGIVGVVFAGILGFSWLANFKIYERDKISLENKLDSNAAEASAKLELKLNELEAKLVKDLAKRLDGISNSIREDVREDIDEINRDILDLKVERLLAESNEHTAAGSISLSISKLIEVCELIIKSPDHSVELDSALIEIHKLLQKGDAGLWLSELTSLIQSLPKQHEVIVERIRDQLKRNAQPKI